MLSILQAIPLDSPALERVLALWPDPQAFVSQASARALGSCGFVGEPAYGNGAGPHTPDDPVDVVVFHGSWAASSVNRHGVGHGAHVRWVLVDARSGESLGGGYADCTTD